MSWGQEQLEFGACRFCKAWIANPLDHHCPGIDADRAKFWCHLWKYLAGLATYFVLSVALEPTLNGTTYYGEKVKGPGIAAICRKCERRFEFLARADNKTTAYELWQHQDECFTIRLATAPIRLTRTRITKPT